MHQIMTDKGYPDLATWVALAMVPMNKMQKKKKASLHLLTIGHPFLKWKKAT